MKSKFSNFCKFMAIKEKSFFKKIGFNYYVIANAHITKPKQSVIIKKSKILNKYSLLKTFVKKQMNH